MSEGDEVIQWGELHVTSARLLFVPRGGEAQSTPQEISVFLPSIAKLEKRTIEEDVQLQISVKDGRTLIYWFGGAHR